MGWAAHGWRLPQRRLLYIIWHGYWPSTYSLSVISESDGPCGAEGWTDVSCASRAPPPESIAAGASRPAWHLLLQRITGGRAMYRCGRQSHWAPASSWDLIRQFDCRALCHCSKRDQEARPFVWCCAPGLGHKDSVMLYATN